MINKPPAHRNPAPTAVALTLVLTLVACQPQPVFLMPTPEVFRTGEVDVFKETPEEERSLVIPVLYATNRIPAANLNKYGYYTQYDDKLRLGVASVHVGDDPNASWSDLYAISTTEERSTEKIPLRLHEVTEYYVLDPGFEPENPASEIEELFTSINEILDKSEDPDLLIFVHGAANSFYNSIAQGKLPQAVSQSRGDPDSRPGKNKSMNPSVLFILNECPPIAQLPCSG